MRTRLRNAGTLVVTLLVVTMASATRGEVAVPYLTGRVVDTAEILGSDARARVTEHLRAHEERSGDQIAVLTIPSLEGESVEDFAQRVFEAWRLGQADRDNGVLMVVAAADRRMRIQVGYGLEPTLTDLAAGRIIRNVITPPFREGDYDAGVEAGVDAIVAVLEGQGAPAEAPVAESHHANFHMEGPDLSVMERILFGAFIFGIIGLFTVLGVLMPGGGWALYPFLIPFWATFPIVVVGVRGAFVLLIAYLVLFPVAKILVSRSPRYRHARHALKTKGVAHVGGFTFGGGGSAGSHGSWSSGSSSFSGGGGHSGGGGASGSW